MKQRHLHRDFHPRATPARKSRLKKGVPLVPTLAAGAFLIAVGSPLFCKPQENPEKQPPKPPTPALAEKGSAQKINYLKSLIAQRKGILDSRSRAASPNDDFESYKESLKYMSVPELKRQWNYYNMLMETGTSPLTPSGGVDWKSAGRRAREAKQRRDAAGGEVKRRKEAGENVQTPRAPNTNPSPQWLGGLQGKSLEELGALLKEEISAVSEAAKYYHDSVESGDEASAADALTEFEEASRHLTAITEAGNAKLNASAHSPGN